MAPACFASDRIKINPFDSKVLGLGGLPTPPARDERFREIVESMKAEFEAPWQSFSTIERYCRCSSSRNRR
jgi:hypothetical protein